MRVNQTFYRKCTTKSSLSKLNSVDTLNPVDIILDRKLYLLDVWLHNSSFDRCHELSCSLKEVNPQCKSLQQFWWRQWTDSKHKTPKLPLIIMASKSGKSRKQFSYPSHLHNINAKICWQFLHWFCDLNYSFTFSCLLSFNNNFVLYLKRWN